MADGSVLVIQHAIMFGMNDSYGIKNASQIGVSGSDVLFNGVTIGSFSGGATGTALTVTFNQHLTLNALSALLRNVTFSTTGMSLPRMCTMTFTDGDGAVSSQMFMVSVV